MTHLAPSRATPVPQGKTPSRQEAARRQAQQLQHDLAVADAPQQYLTFLLNGEMFAVGILNVKEIIEYGSVTEIPMMPVFIRGVINLRGSVVPVIDLAARFGRAPSLVGKRSCIVILEVAETEFRHDIGVMVDAVSEVLEIPSGDIEPPPAFGAKIRADFIHGMGKVNDKFVILLNVDKVLSAEEIAQLTGMETAPAPTDERPSASV